MAASSRPDKDFNKPDGKFPNECALLDSDMCDGIVTVKVANGGQTRTFHVSRRLLCHHSSYFQSALSNEWKESVQQEVTLEDTAPETFNAFLDWMYTQHLAVDQDALDKHADGNAAKNALPPLIDLWIFCDARGVAHLQDVTMDLMVRIMGPNYITFDAGQIRRIYTSTTSDSPLRKFSVEMFMLTSGDVACDFRFMDDELESGLALDYYRDIATRLSQFHHENMAYVFGDFVTTIKEFHVSPSKKRKRG